MSDPIKVGDLVMVVRGNSCCVPHLGLGAILSVERIEPARRYGCGRCKWSISDGRPLARVRSADGRVGYTECSRLKKIDPLAKDETTDQPEELTA